MNDHREAVPVEGAREVTIEGLGAAPESTPKEFEELVRQEERAGVFGDDGICPLDSRDNPEINAGEVEGVAPLIARRRNEKGTDLAVIHDDEQGIDDLDPFPESQPAQGSGVAAEPPIVEANKRQLMPSENEETLAEFSNLTELEDTFKRIEAQQVEISHSQTAAIEKARADVVLAIRQVYLSSLNLGKSLLSYRAALKADRGWMEAVKAVAGFIHRSERTVRNMVSGYERLSAVLPDVLIDVAGSRGIDLAWKKFETAVRIIEATIRPHDIVDEERAARFLERVIPITPASKRPKPKLELMDFAMRTAKTFERRFKGISPKARKDDVQYVFEVINSTLRSSVRALSQYDRPEKVPKPSPDKGGVVVA